MVGIRDLDAAEDEIVQNSGVHVARAADITRDTATLTGALDALRSHVEDVYLHIDVDAFDPQVVPGVEYETAGGLSLAHMKQAIEAIGDRFNIRAVALSAFSPEFDKDNKTTDVCSELVECTVRAAGAVR